METIWKFETNTPANGKCYHFGRFIKVEYLNKTRLYLVSKGKSLFPCFGDLILETRQATIRKSRTVETNLRRKNENNKTELS